MENLENVMRIDYNQIGNPILKQVFRKYDEYSHGKLPAREIGCSYNKGSHSKHSKGGSGGCYITTACLSAMGIAHEGSRELEAIKMATKEHILKSGQGKRDYILYHRKAPRLVDEIEARSDSKEIWRRVYERLKDITQNIFSGELERGYQSYKSLVTELEAQLLQG